jgi:hypothetical protein
MSAFRYSRRLASISELLELLGIGFFNFYPWGELGLYPGYGLGRLEHEGWIWLMLKESCFFLILTGIRPFEFTHYSGYYLWGRETGQ